MDLKFHFTLNTLLEQGRIDQADVDHLKQWLTTETLPKLTDEQIALFLLSCDNKHDDAKVVIKSYYKIREMEPKLFANRRVKHNEQLQRQLKVGVYSILPRRTADNCAIIVLKLQDSNPNNFDFESHLKLICMVLDATAYSDPPRGLISILDLQGTSLMHLTNVKLGLVKIFTRYVQECLPLKLKSVHLFNGGYVLNALFSLFKPFLRKEVKELIHFHSGVNMDSFYETWLEKGLLPGDYGGELSSILTYHERTAEKLVAMQSHFEAEERQRTELINVSF